MKVGETALYVALSYAAGALLCLVVMNMESGAASACAAVLPVLSGCSFLLSNRFYAQQTGSPAMFSEEAAETGESETVFPYMNRMACALALYALLFGLCLFFAGQLISQAVDLARSVPGFIADLQGLYNELITWLQEVLSRLPAEYASVGDEIFSLLNSAWEWLKTLLSGALGFGYVGIFVAQAASPVIPALIGGAYLRHWTRSHGVERGK